MRVLLLLLAILAPRADASAQTEPGARLPAPLELDQTRQRPVLLGSREVVRASDDPLPAGLTPIQRAIQSRDRIEDGMQQVELSVVLDQNGRVESATPTGGTKRFYEQAAAIEMRRVFEPVRDAQGLTVRAHFSDSVGIAPPERWLAHPPAFPERVELGTFRLELERTGCLGSCPAYKVTVTGLGDVIWQGGLYSAVPGTHHARISPEAVQGLLEQVRASHLLAARDKYEAGWTDNPTYTVTLDLNGMHKQVVDYIGIIVGMPTSIEDLENTIDQVAGTEKWLKGSAGLMPSLVAEHWAFAAASKDNLQLYDMALKNGDRDLLAAFLLARAPVFSADPATESPVCVASGFADSHAALELLGTLPKDRKLPQFTLNACLVSAARGRNLELVNLWLKLGASVNPAPLPHAGQADSENTPQPEHPLDAAIEGGSPAVVDRLLEAHAPIDPARNGGRNLVTFAGESCCVASLEERRAVLEHLLQAGADPNLETDRDRPALFGLGENAELVPLLVAGGAKINQRDQAGDFALMYTVDLKTLNALLEAGADPTLRDRQGQTAGEKFRAEGLKEQADLLDAAARARLGLTPAAAPAAGASSPH